MRDKSTRLPPKLASVAQQLTVTLGVASVTLSTPFLLYGRVALTERPAFIRLEAITIVRVITRHGLIVRLRLLHVLVTFSSFLWFFSKTDVIQCPSHQ